MTTEQTPAYQKAYAAAQAGGMNETDSHELGLEAADARAADDNPTASLASALRREVRGGKIRVRQAERVAFAAGITGGPGLPPTLLP